MPTSLPTAPPAETLDDERRSQWAHRIFVAALGLFVVLGAVGFFGVRSAETSTSAEGYRLTVTYAKVTRGGLATPWSVEVRKEGGFDGPVVLAVTSSYLEMFDENGLDPDPAAATSDDEFTIWEFDPPSGDTLSVSLDARIEPAVQSGRGGVLQVRDGDRVVAAVSFSTRVMP